MQTITIPASSAARVAFLMDGDYMTPCIRPGEVVLLEWALPAVGDCGLFEVDGSILLRQYCEDSFGNVYLFALNRARRELDLTVPAEQPVRCLGRLLLEKDHPLPLD